MQTISKTEENFQSLYTMQSLTETPLLGRSDAQEIVEYLSTIEDEKKAAYAFNLIYGCVLPLENAVEFIEKTTALIVVEAGFASDNQLLMFPAGLCSRRQKGGIIRDLEWKKAFIVKSVQHRRDVVPIHFDGRNSNFFYNLANVCKALGIKFNIAMLYLADEMLKNRHKTFTITIGKPIPWQTFDKSRTPQQWAQYVKDIVYKL